MAFLGRVAGVDEDESKWVMLRSLTIDEVSHG